MLQYFCIEKKRKKKNFFCAYKGLFIEQKIGVLLRGRQK